MCKNKDKTLIPRKRKLCAQRVRLPLNKRFNKTFGTISDKYIFENNYTKLWRESKYFEKQKKLKLSWISNNYDY